jgi:hypothetical protein
MLNSKDGTAHRGPLNTGESSRGRSHARDLEQIFETYYSYALTPQRHLSFDYQDITNPAYNTDCGPVNVFSGRIRWKF